MENRNLQRNIFERAHPFLYASDNIYLLLQVKLVILHFLRTRTKPFSKMRVMKIPLLVRLTNQKKR